MFDDVTTRGVYQNRFMCTSPLVRSSNNSPQDKYEDPDERPQHFPMSDKTLFVAANAYLFRITADAKRETIAPSDRFVRNALISKLQKIITFTGNCVAGQKSSKSDKEIDNDEFSHFLHWKGAVRVRRVIVRG